MILDIHDMITPADCNSFLSESSPWDRMFRDLSSILRIGRIVIVVLINDEEGFRIAFLISDDIEDYGNVFLRRVCESIVHLPIEIGDNESLIWWRESTLRRVTEIYETLSSNPLIGREISLSGYCLRKCSTLSSILRSECLLRKLRIHTISSIWYSSSFWSMYHHIEIFIIDWWFPSREDRSTRNYPTLPVFRGNTREKWENIREWREEWSGHVILLNNTNLFLADLLL